ncbi:MAG TPA: 16S rRNA (adenine(1518)-N(6)/adenine(1519)-N(6))-dimethyltransferase RsmA [bacterium]|nr:16S rRNA (adenine(1518)-N(6)/adenine(1519)-N(6))-dimethyltransferase RsmA [bacterium]
MAKYESKNPRRPRAGSGKPKLRAHKSLSQNFLIDPAIAERIAVALPIQRHDLIYEIGPGKGFITERLVDLVDGRERVWVVEKDSRMVGMLKKKYPSGGKVRVIFADVLDLPPDAEPPTRCWLIGNLPFGIGHAILAWAIARGERFPGAVLTLQREVVRRLLAKPGDSDRSAASVWFQSHARGQALFDIPPRAFHPPPRVTSTVMWVEFVPTTPGLREIPGVEYIVQKAFAQKRKTLANNLRQIPEISQAKWDLLKSECAELLSMRAEQLSADDFARLARLLDLGAMPRP